MYYAPRQNLFTTYIGSDSLIVNSYGIERSYSINKERGEKHSTAYLSCIDCFVRNKEVSHNDEANGIRTSVNLYTTTAKDYLGNTWTAPLDEDSFWSEYAKYWEKLLDMNCRTLNSFEYRANEENLNKALSSKDSNNLMTEENITSTDEPEEIALSDEEMRPYYQQEAAAFKEKLLSEMNGESGVKFGVVSCVGTGMPELIIAKPLNPYGMYSMGIYQWDGELTSCGTIEGNNIQYILGRDGISITSYTDIGSADGNLTSVSLNCYQCDNNRISLAETYNYTLQYTYDLGSMAVTGTNKSYTVTASDSGVTETLTKDEFYQRIDNIVVEYQVMFYDLTEENISAVLNDENSYPHSMAVENRIFFERYE